jgi:hypothetical protein
MSHVHEKTGEAKKRKASLPGVGDDDDDDERPLKRTASTAGRSTLDSPALSASQHANTTGYSRSQLELWEYIRPHLDVFQNKPIPKRCWVPDLLALPRVRDLKFNPRRSGKRPYVDTDDKKVAALLLHLTGKPASQPCSRCLNGNGAFDGCVKLSTNALLGANIKNCANCWYAHQACTYETAAEDDHIVVKDDSAQELDIEVEDVPEVSERQPWKNQQLDNDSMPVIHTTLSGRRYYEWPGKSSDQFSTHT